MIKSFSGNYEQFFHEHRKSRWASADEIKKSTSYINTIDEHFDAAGIPILSNGKDIYVDGSDTHSIVFGSTGSKKTRLLCMPLINILCRAGESFIVSDPKGELYEKTSGQAEKEGYRVITLDFRNIGSGDCWNPLSKPYELYHSGQKDEAISLLNDFINSISDPHEKKSVDQFWPTMASSLALANLLLLVECGKKEEVHLASFAKLCSADSMEKLKEIKKMIDPESIAGMNYNGVFVSAEKTIDSIFVSLFAMVKVFNIHQQLTQKLSQSTFDICSIGKEKTAVYLIVPDEKTTFNFLISTFIKQTYQMLISESQKESGGRMPVRVNFILDEFCNIPTIDDMSAMISAARSRNMRFYLIVQSIRQLRDKYGDTADTIKGNCENWIFLNTKELELLDEISMLCGQNDGVCLISPSELQHLNKERGEALIIHGRDFPIVTELADIDEYVNFNDVPPAEKKDYPRQRICFFDLNSLIRETADSGKILFSSNEETNESLSKEPPYAKELEKEFNRIFGKLLPDELK